MTRSVWVVFFSYCLISSIAWLVPFDALGSISSLGTAGLVYLFLGAVGFVVGWRKWRIGQWVRLAGWCVALVGIPDLLVAWARREIPAVGITALFGLVPIAIVVVASIEGEMRGYLAPALTGLGGLMLILPVSVPESLRGRVMLGAALCAVVMVAVTSVRMYRLLRGVGQRDAVTVFCLSNGVFLAVCSGMVGEGIDWSLYGVRSVFSVGSLIDAVSTILLVGLLRRMLPVRLGARYFVIPLFTVVEGFVALRPEVTWRLGVGVALLGGAAWMLLARPEEERLSLR